MNKMVSISEMVKNENKLWTQNISQSLLIKYFWYLLLRYNTF